MKPLSTTILLLALILNGLQAQQVDDDVYFTPSEAKKEKLVVKPKVQKKPTYKNGAKEIIFIQTDNEKKIISKGDTIYVLSELNDSLALGNDTLQSEEDGYYLNDFNGSESDFEYAERIRKFHNPRYTIHISDPQYTDIYFLNSSDWNVYTDGSYAWITPTWTNPFWFDYQYRPFSYSSWNWRHNVWGPASLYSSWYSPWHYGWGNNYYGNYYGGYYDSWYWGSGYYGGYYGGYYDWYSPYYGGGYPYWGGSHVTHQTSRNRNYNEATRREHYYSGSTRQTISGGTARVGATGSDRIVTRNSVVSADRTVRVVNGTNTPNVRSSSAIRSQTEPTLRNESTFRSTGTRTTSRSSDIINTRPRTTEVTSGNRRSESVTVATPRTSTATSRSTVISTPRSSSSPAVRSSSSSSSGSTYRSSSSGESSRSSYTPSSSSSSYTPSSSSSSSSSSSRSSSPSYSGGSSSSGSSRSSGSSGGRR